MSSLNNYLNFNKWVYFYYVNRNHNSEYGTFAIDLDIFKKENQVDRLEYPEIKFGNWSKLLSPVVDNIDSIPQYFGLIALQCYAALLMEHDGVISDSVYRKRFISLAGLKTEADLNNCFKELHQDKPVQEVIWQKAVVHFHELGARIKIPDPKTLPGRYVQFPKSQVVLNKEDLKEYIPLFREIALNVDQISDIDFNNYFEKNIPKYISHMRRANNRLQRIDVLEQNIKRSQIFNFYCSEWEDSYIHKKANKVNQIDDFAIARVEAGIVEIFDSAFRKLDIEEILDSDYLFFKKSDYPKEYELQSSLSYDSEFLVCFRSGINILGKGESLIFHHKNILFIRVTFNRDDQMGVLARYIFEPFPIVVQGLRIGRKRCYLYGIGPIIKTVSEDVTYSLLFEGKKLKYPFLNALEVGTYIIRTPKFNDFVFEVSDTVGLEESVESMGGGRSLSSYELAKEGDRLEGMMFLMEAVTNKTRTINDWIAEHTSLTYFESCSDLMKKILKCQKYGGN